MKKKCWIIFMAAFVFIGLCFNVSCSKITVMSEADVGMTEKQALTVQAPTDEKTKVEEGQGEKPLTRQQSQAEGRFSEEQRRQAKITSQIESTRKRVFLNELILFEFDSSVLTKTAKDRLKSKAEWLDLNPDISIIVEGHCDERGTKAYNLALGERRAQTAKAFLFDMGISGSRVSTVSYGEERPFSAGYFEGAWSLNRRAHFVID